MRIIHAATDRSVGGITMAFFGLTMRLPCRDGVFPYEDCVESPLDMTDPGALRMCQIWEAALETSRVRPDDDYFALGGESLQAIEILTEVQKVFGVRLPMSSLFAAPTPAQLATLAHEGGIDPDSPPLVRLSHGGEGPPLFLLPGAGDNAFVFDKLLRAADLGRPIYGFRLPAAGSGEVISSSLVAVAGRYVQNLIAVQPDGPYYLGGYSLGGRLAYEIARQLDASGRRVAFLGLIDTYGPGHPAPMSPLRRMWSHLRFAIHSDRQQRRRYFRERLLRVGERVKVLKKRLPVHPWSDRLLVPDYIRDDFHYQRWLSRRYVPAAYGGRLTLFRASTVPDVVGTDFSDPCMGWGRLAKGGVEVRPVPGDHGSLLREPHVGALAISLRACLAG
jgi:thioesterase domain-containing protein/acyl carrier protein